MGCIFQFYSISFFGLHVAKTIGKGIVDIGVIDNVVILGTLVGACAWNIITWYFGLPTSSSHALIGGLIGSALAKVGPAVLIWKGILKTIIFIFVSPTLGLFSGTCLWNPGLSSCKKFQSNKNRPHFQKGATCVCGCI